MTLPPALDDRPVALIFRSPLFNPSEIFIQRQAAGLRRYQPVVAGLEDKGGVVPALRDRMIVASAGEGLALKLGGAGALARRLAEVRPKLLHAHFGPDGLLALPLARRLGVPLVTTLRGYDVSRTRGALLLSGHLSWMRYALGEGRLMRQGTLFLTVSDALRAGAAARGFPESRLVTHYNGVDLDVFQPAPEPPTERVVLHIGRLVEKKGTALLIDAFARVAEENTDATLLIVGDGPLRGTLERQAAPLAGRVRFLGHSPPEELTALMRGAWLLVAPSLTARDGDSEGLPNVVVEAAASGVPVVASAHAGIPEAVEHEATGLIVPEGEVAALAEALRTLLASSDLQRSYALAGRKLAETRFDARRQAERLEELYDEVVAAA
jgi:colanic acid/amylovoran biosynthesis glycosyltransferase